MIFDNLEKSRCFDTVIVEPKKMGKTQGVVLPEID